MLIQAEGPSGAIGIKADAGGNLLTSPGVASTTHVGSSALEASHVVATAARSLYRAACLNSSGVDLWLFVLDATILPADGAVPSRTPIPCPAGSIGIDEWQGGTALTTGCVLALSSTLATLTIAGAVGWFDAEVRS